MSNVSTDDVCGTILECCAQMEPDESAEAQHLQFLFSRLESYITEFEQAVHLYAHLRATLKRPEIPLDAEGNPATQGWSMDKIQAYHKELERHLILIVIPARDAVITIYHIEQTILAIRQNTGRCKIILHQHNGELSREAWKAFRKHFASATKMRHAYAHAAEHMKTLAEWKRHAPDGAYTHFSVSGAGVLSLSRYQETFTLGVNQESIDRLREIQQTLHHAYLPARK